MFAKLFTLGLLAAPALAHGSRRHIEEDHLEKRAAQAGMVPVIEQCTVDKTMAVTFDDGPNFNGWDADLLKTLKQYGANATFFLNGYNWGCAYDAADDIKAIFNAGHQIGSHSWSHPDLTTLSEKEIDHQFALTETMFAKILGVRPLYARAPYGAYNDAVRRVLYKRGYKALLQWTIVSGDADGASASSQIAQYKNAKSKDIALNHDQYKSTIYQSMPKVLPQLVKKGLKLSTIGQCLNGPNGAPKAKGKDAYYVTVGKPQKKDSTWTCAGTPAPSD